MALSRAPNVSADSALSAPPRYPSDAGVTAAVSRQVSRVTAKTYAGPPGITLRDIPYDTVLLNALLERSGIDHRHRTSPEHVHGTGMVGAWDGDALIGAARVISNGDVTLLMDVVVDPGYRRRGIARALVAAATRAAPGPVWHLGTQSGESAAFLTALGAQRATDAWRLG